MRYLFRAPVFPVLFKRGPKAVCAATPADLDSYLKANASQMEKECALIDSRWEGWALFPQEALISPMAMKKRYSKREFLLFCGVSEEHVAITNLNKYTRDQIFEYVVHEALRQA